MSHPESELIGEAGLEMTSSILFFASSESEEVGFKAVPVVGRFNFAATEAFKLAWEPASCAVNWFRFRPGMAAPGKRGSAPCWPSWASNCGGIIGIWGDRATRLGKELADDPESAPEPGLPVAADTEGIIGRRGIEPYRAA